jgi:hypothetical protein
MLYTWQYSTSAHHCVRALNIPNTVLERSHSNDTVSQVSPGSVHIPTCEWYWKTPRYDFTHEESHIHLSSMLHHSSISIMRQRLVYTSGVDSFKPFPAPEIPIYIASCYRDVVIILASVYRSRTFDSQ